MRSPRPGDVIHYRYLWRHEAARDIEDGAKARPCLVIATQQTERGLVIYTTPISSKNHDPAHSIPVPLPVRTALGLSKASLVVWNDLNRFVWVGPDVEFKSDEQPYYGNVGQDFWNSVRKKILAAAVAPTIRTE